MSINKMIKDIEKGCKNDIPSKYLALFGIKEERQCGDLTKSPDDLECGEENELDYKGWLLYPPRRSRTSHIQSKEAELRCNKKI